MSTELHYCVCHRCPGLPYRASERPHPPECVGPDRQREGGNYFDREEVWEIGSLHSAAGWLERTSYEAPTWDRDTRAERVRERREELVESCAAYLRLRGFVVEAPPAVSADVMISENLLPYVRPEMRDRVSVIRAGEDVPTREQVQAWADEDHEVARRRLALIRQVIQQDSETPLHAVNLIAAILAAPVKP